MNISELQRDAICELVNIGMGRAAQSLGKMVDDRIVLSIPALELISHDTMLELVKGRGGNPVTAIKERFTGVFQGDAFLVFPEQNSLELVRTLLNDDLPVESLMEMERDSLLEIGNIVLNACLGTFINLLSCKLDIDLPELCRDSLDGILGNGRNARDSHYLMMRIDFSTHRKMIEGYLIFLFDDRFTAAFLSQIDSYIDNI